MKSGQLYQWYMYAFFKLFLKLHYLKLRTSLFIRGNKTKQNRERQTESFLTVHEKHVHKKSSMVTLVCHIWS